MAGLLDALLDPQFRKDVRQGLTDAANRGAVAGLLGGPVFPGNEGLLSILERNGQPIR